MIERNKEDYYSLTDIMIRLKSFFGYLCRKWWLFVIACVAGSGIGTIYYFVQKPKYEAVCTFILEEKQSNMGGLSSIASQFGFDVGGMNGGGSLFAGDNILDILRSKKVVQQVLLSHTDRKESENNTLADLYLEFSGLKKKWQTFSPLANIRFSSTNASLSPVQDSVLNIIYDAVLKKSLVAERINKKGTIIKVQITATNDHFAKLMTERLVDEASKMYLNIKTGTAQASIGRMQRRSDSLLALLNNKSYVAAASQPLDANPGIKAAIVPTEIAMRDKTVIATLYTEVTKNLEASKLLLSQQTPVIQLLDRPGLSLYDNKKKLFFLVIIGGLVSVVACLAFLGVVYFLRRHFLNKPWLLLN